MYRTPLERPDSVVRAPNLWFNYSDFPIRPDNLKNVGTALPG